MLRPLVRAAPLSRPTSLCALSTTTTSWTVEVLFPARARGAARAPTAALRGLTATLRALLLPESYPASVAPCYLRYSLFAAAGTIFSAAGGVLATQSLLQALGVGAAAALPAAAATNWVLKDGLGQLGGMLYAALLGHRFDSDPKRWRQASAIASDAAGALEVCMALAPLPFLPAAALANVARNVAWLSASATRAGIHNALAQRGNLADVTARAGSQTTAAASAGTALGVGVAAALAGVAGGGAPPAATLLAFALLSLAHQACVYASLRAAVLPALSPARLALAWGALPSLPAARARAHAPLSPTEVCASEAFFPLPRWAVGGAHRALQLAPPLRPGAAAALAASVGACGRDAPTHVLAPGAPGGGLLLLLGEGASGEDALRAHLHAARGAWELREGARCAGTGCNAQGAGGPCAACAAAALRRAGEWAEQVAPSAACALRAAGWDTAQLAALEGPPERRVRLRRGAAAAHWQ